MEKASQLDGPCLSKIVWSLGRLGYKEPFVFGALAAQVHANVSTYSLECLSRLAVGFALGDHADNVLLHHICEAALMRLSSPEEDASTTMNMHGHMGSEAPRACANLLWGLAAARHYEPVLYEAALSCCVSGLGMLPPDDLVQVLWAMSRWVRA